MSRFQRIAGAPAAASGPVRPGPIACARTAALVALVLPLLPAGSARAEFLDVTVPWGIDAGDSMSYSAGFHDYDGDGDLDLFVTNHWKGRANLYRNEGGTGYVDVGQHYGAGNSDRHDHIWADLDNDGDPDQYIIHGRTQANELFWNLGNGVWSDQATAAGVDDMDGRGREITVNDFDRDGWLDIFVVNDYRPGFLRPNRLFMNRGDRTFSTFPNTATMFEARLHVAGADYDLDGWPDLVTTNPPYQPGEVWRNQGDGTFENVVSTAFAGITEPLRQAQGLAWGDYDADGDLDLFTSSGNRGLWDHAALYADTLRWYVALDPDEEKSVRLSTDADSVTVSWTEGDWQELTLWYGAGGATTATSPITLALADIQGMPPGPPAGTPGLALWSLTDLDGASVRLRARSGSTAAYTVGGGLRPVGGTFGVVTKTGFDPKPNYANADWSNRLYRNEGDGTFVEVTAQAFAVNDSGANSMGASWGDYDNDGRLDLYVVNGGTILTGNQPNYLYRNQGDGTFAEVAGDEWVQGSTRGMGDGAMWGDVDGDGFLDLYVDNGAEHPPYGIGPRQLLLNPGNGNHWLQLEIRGLGAVNGSAIGARVKIVAGGAAQWRTILGESDNCFTGGTTVHFGLGAASLVDSIRVFWPDETTSLFTFIGGDRHYVLVKGKPIRQVANPHLLLLDHDIQATIPDGTVETFPVAMDNWGGIAAQYVATRQDCGGGPAPAWLSLTADSGSVWPGGTGALPPEVLVDTTGLSPGTYCGRIVFTSNSVAGPETLLVSIDVESSAVGAGPGDPVPGTFALGAPRPNPAGGRTALRLELPRAAFVDARVVDVTGRLVATLARGERAAGRHELAWSGRDDSGSRVAAGLYLVRVTAGEHRAVRKVVLVD